MRLHQRRKAQAQAPAADERARQGRKTQGGKHAALLEHVALAHDEAVGTSGHDQSRRTDAVGAVAG